MYAVIDAETTGFSPLSDRIIELAIIGVNGKGDKEWEWCSLINPERDTGPGLVVRKHQIYPRDVDGAPIFADFAGEISRMLEGRALVAHNARFDLQMLGGEFERLGYNLPDVAYICTMTVAKEAGFRPYRLDSCCEALSIKLKGLHHALADAHATTNLAHELIDFSNPEFRKHVDKQLRHRDPWPKPPLRSVSPVTRKISPVRSAVSTDASARPQAEKASRRVSSTESIPTVDSFSFDKDSAEGQYLAAVEEALADREITHEEGEILRSLQIELNLSDEEIGDIHRKFLQGLAGSMWSDGLISNHEQFDLDLVGELLDLSTDDVEYARDNPIGLGLFSEEYALEPGDRIVFTGEMSIPRSEWKERAIRAGLKVTSAVSRKTDYLVVPFGETGSSKSRKARELGVRVVSEQRFWRMFASLKKTICHY